MGFYDTDLVDIKHYIINQETGNKLLSSTETNVKCRVEHDNSMILSDSGKEEKAKYLILIKVRNLTTLVRECDGVIVKSIMGRSFVGKEFDIKQLFYAGSRSMTHLEIKV